LPLIQSKIVDIPVQYRSGLITLKTLPSESFDELVSALKRAPLVANRKELGAWVAPEVKSIPASDVSAIVNTLTSLYRIRVRREMASDRLIGDVVEAMRKLPELRLSDDSERIVTERLVKLLNLDAFGVVETKALELKSEFEHAFCDCRIFTDLRPVFGGNVADSPKAMLIVHTLKLGYHDAHENTHREFHIALDGSDLITLRGLIERAETKAKTLRTQLESAGITPMELA